MRPEKRKISFGTIFMLSLTGLVLAGTLLVLLRLSSGATVDLSRLKPGTVELQERYDGPAPADSGSNDEQSSSVAATAIPAPEQPAAAEQNRPVSCTLTFGGITAVEGEVRKNSYISDVKQYDFSDIMMLLKKELRSDLNVVFLENILTDEGKTSDTIVPRETATMLKTAGFNLAACGFSKAYGLESTGILSTRNALTERGIYPAGIWDEGQDRIQVMDINGLQVAVMQYTDTIPAATRKIMTKKEQNDMVPAADPVMIADDITKAREKGAQAVIILANWGKTGKAPDKAQRALAQQIADAGADLIIGSGSRVVQGMEKLTAAGSGQEVPCFWSLGTVLSGARNNASRLAGMLVHISLSAEGGGKAGILQMTYTPLYTWKYKQDGRYYYRCTACGKVPDGMDAEQQKMMEKTAGIVRDAMKDTGLEERAVE